MNTKLLIENERNAITMSELQFNGLLGSILADANISTSSKTTARIRWNHSWKQHDYCTHKYEVLKEFATQPPRRKPNPGYGDEWSCLTLKTTHLYFLLHQLCYTKDKRKHITEEYLSLITHPIALAWMLCDDGNRLPEVNSAAISMGSFSKEDVELFRRWLKARWSIASVIQTVQHTSTNKTGFVLRFNKEGFLALSALIEPYVPESMHHKIEVITKTCGHCGKVFPLARSGWCSKECAVIGRKQKKHEYYLKNKEHCREKGREWQAAHRDQLNAAAREARQKISPEKRQELAAYAAEYREANKDKLNAYKRERRARLKGDAEYERELKEERKRYYERKKADPERYQKALESARVQRKRPKEMARA